MTVREDLKNKLQAEYLRVPEKFYNQNNLEMTWSKEEHLYSGTDAKEEEWIAAYQDSRVPIFAVHCPNKKDDNNVNCNAVNFVAICYDGEETTCRKCKQKFTPKLVVPESSVAYKMFQELDK